MIKDCFGDGESAPIQSQKGLPTGRNSVKNEKRLLGTVFGLHEKIPIPMSGSNLACEIKNTDESLCCQILAERLDGKLVGNSVQFDSNILTGEFIKHTTDRGLAISKWKCLPYYPIHIRKLPAEADGEKKFVLLYFLNPASFSIGNVKKFRIKGSRNNIIVSNDRTLEFYLLPKQQFYLFEVSFSPSWLIEQLKNADPLVKENIDEYITANRQTFLVQPFTLEEYKLLHELEVCMLIDRVEDFFIRSRVYNLVVSYFNKIIKRNESPLIQTAVQYDQLIEAEMMIMENIKTTPAIGA